MSKKKRQFKGTATPKTFYDRKVRKVGYSRVVSLSKIIPENWAWVRMQTLNQTDGAIEVLFTKLMGIDEITQVKGARQEGE